VQLGAIAYLNPVNPHNRVCRGKTVSPMTPSVPCRVFIADDIAALRALWRQFLGDDPDIEIVGEASDGAEAIDGVRKTRPDVLVLDLSMPRVDGLQVIRTLRAEQAETRIVVASGFASARLAPLALELGATSYFEKGGSAVALRHAVREAYEAAHRIDGVSPSTDG
jgi:DNA-binding NarL/FixJ family response regulator